MPVEFTETLQTQSIISDMMIIVRLNQFTLYVERKCIQMINNWNLYLGDGDDDTDTSGSGSEDQDGSGD